MAQVIEADLTWTGSGFERGVRVGVGDDGRITTVGGQSGDVTLRLAGRALLPGFVNAHSHAFQRGLRGRGEQFPSGSGSFWSWREAMYKLVGQLDGTRFYELTLQAFREMLAAGITSVGEFHYLHHSASLDETPKSAFDFDELVLRAASEAGIRIVLLNVFYKTGGIGKPLLGDQLRFETRSIIEYWHQMDRLDKLRDPGLQSLGAVAHSIRAVPPDHLSILHTEAKRRKLPFHMHVEEQPQEIQDSLLEYGKNPMSIVLDLEPGPEFTAVHCTHTTPSDLRRFLDLGGNICITPLTEANLGDGTADHGEIRESMGQVSLGTDSNARISLIEEMRWLEYNQRVTGEMRGAWIDEQGSVSRPILRAATEGGARALGIETGRIATGLFADFAVVNLSASSLAGHDDESLLDVIIFGCSEEIISDVCVGGDWKRVR